MTLASGFSDGDKQKLFPPHEEMGVGFLYSWIRMGWSLEHARECEVARVGELECNYLCGI